MSLSDAERVSALPRLPRDEGGPVFAEPWQAQAFALAVKLSERGHFTWKEWAATLSDELAAAARRGEADDGSRYYEHWLTALERLVTAKGLANRTALSSARKPGPTPTETPRTGSLSSFLARRQCLKDAGFFSVWLLPLVRTGSLQHASVSPFGEWGAWVIGEGSGGHLVDPQLGFAASAGLGSLLGMRHALEPDHLVAVSTLMTGERTSAKAAWLGACWGLGHTLTLLLAGAILVVLRAEMPAVATEAFELGVVLLLVGFGARAIHQGVCHVGATGRTHSHATRGTSTRARIGGGMLARPLLVGAVHGLAGSGALTALVVATLPSTVTRLSYLAMFGVGSILGMAALSGLVGWQIARLGTHRAVTRTLAIAVGCVSTALGLLWGYPLIGRLF